MPCGTSLQTGQAQLSEARFPEVRPSTLAKIQHELLEMPNGVQAACRRRALRARQRRRSCTVGRVHRSRKLAAGETLFKAGDSGDSLFVVHSGEVELYIKDTAGQKIVLTVSSAGDVFGELSLLDQGARTATATALVDTELLELDRDDLLLLFGKRPEAALGLLAAMGHMTRKA